MIKFYDVKLRTAVMIPEEKVEKKTYERVTKAGAKQIRFALRGKTSDGRNLTRFVSKADYDKMK